MIDINPDTAPGITKAASKQTYYTIRFLADRERVADAYRAYAYFRWVDDILDGAPISDPDRIDFLQRQKSLLERTCLNESVSVANPHEQMLIDLIQRDSEMNSGLTSYLCNMMNVMSFDAGRRGRVISQTELDEYTRWLAIAVTEALHHFIGHGCFSPRDDSRYLAVSAAHITHMLRDMFDDVEIGYYNIPKEILNVNHVRARDLETNACRAWVQSRVQLARSYFKLGKNHFSHVGNFRCKLAGFAYIARFEWLLDTIEREDFCLRPHYDERRSFGTSLRMGLDTFSAMLHLGGADAIPEAGSVRTSSLEGS